MFHFLLVIGCLISGLLASSNLIEARVPQMSSVLKYLSPFKIIIGVATLVLGLIGLKTDVLTGIAGIVVGAVLAISLLNHIPSLKDETREKISSTLLSYQMPIGVIAFIIGVIALFAGRSTLF